MMMALTDRPRDASLSNQGTESPGAGVEHAAEGFGKAEGVGILPHTRCHAVQLQVCAAQQAWRGAGGFLPIPDGTISPAPPNPRRQAQRPTTSAGWRPGVDNLRFFAGGTSLGITSTDFDEIKLGTTWAEVI